MRKLEKRAVICLILAAMLFLGLCFFVGEYVVKGGDWATFYGNSHVYSNGHLAIGKIYDVNGKLLASNGKESIKYSSDATTRKATVHGHDVDFSKVSDADEYPDDYKTADDQTPYPAADCEYAVSRQRTVIYHYCCPAHKLQHVEKCKEQAAYVAKAHLGGFHADWLDTADIARYVPTLALSKSGYG